MRRRPIELLAALCALAIAAGAITAWDAFAGAWLPPQPLSDIGATSQFAPSSDVAQREVVIAPDGTVLAAWLRSDGADRRVEARIRPAPGRLSTVQVLSAAGEEASRPQLAVDSDGNAIAMWSSGGAVHYSLRDAHSKTFGAAQSPPAGTVEAVDDVTFDSAGEAVAVWTADGEVRASVRPPDGQFGAPEKLDSLDRHSIADGTVSAPLAAADAHGSVYATWSVSGYGATGTSDLNSLRTSIEGAIRPPSGPFGPAALSSSGTCLFEICLPGPTAIAAGENDAVVAWQARTLSNTGPSYLGAAGFRAPIAGRVPAQFDATPPQIAVDAKGDVVLVWSKDAFIDFAIAPAGGVLDEYPAYLAGTSPRLAADGRGRTYAVWDAGHARAAIREHGRPFRDLQEISSSNAVDSPDVAADALGNAVATWVEPEAGAWRLYAAAYDGSGPQLRALHVPKHSRTGTRITFSVLPRDVWSPIRSTVWSFADGHRKRGAVARHTYKYAGGRFRVKVTATDAAGNATTARRRIRIRDVTRPRVQRLSASSDGRLAFRLTERATVRIAIARRVHGRYRHVTTLVRKRRKAGPNTAGFHGHAGRYLATVTATDRTGHRSRPRSLFFRVAR